MAIQLPRAGAGSVGTGGRRRIAQLPDAGDVPQQDVARDPGLSVPNIAQFETGLSDIGAAATDVATRFAEADARINARRNSVERMRSGREFNDFASETFTEFESSRDFSREEDAAAFGAALAARQAEILGAHQGSEESKLRLAERLEAIRQTFSDRAGVASVKAQDALVEREFNEILNGLTGRVRLGEDPRTLIAEGMAHLEAEKDALRPGQELAFIRTLNARVYGAKADDLLAKGAFDEAEDLLEIPEVRAAIGEDGQRRAFDRIAAIRREGQARILTETESMQLGFPEGVIVQKKSDGSFNVVFKPEQDSTKRGRKIQDLVDRGVEQARAQDIVDGNIRIEVVPGLGVVREVNEVEGTAREVPLGQDELPQATSPSPGQSLFGLAQSGAIAGIVPATQEFLGRTAGQIPGVPVATDVIEARQKVRVAQNELIRALSINPRFPVGEINRIRAEIKIEPAVLDSQRALLSRMQGIDSALRLRLANEQAAAADISLPQDTRSSAAQAAKDIGNFLQLLGMPENFDPDRIVPEGIPEFSTKIGVTRDGNEVWQTPDGRRLVVE